MNSFGKVQINRQAWLLGDPPYERRIYKVTICTATCLLSTKTIPPSQTVQEPPGSMVWLLSDKNNIKINVVRKYAYTYPTTNISFQGAPHLSHCSKKF